MREDGSSRFALVQHLQVRNSCRSAAVQLLQVRNGCRSAAVAHLEIICYWIFLSWEVLRISKFCEFAAKKKILIIHLDKLWNTKIVKIVIRSTFPWTSTSLRLTSKHQTLLPTKGQSKILPVKGSPKLQDPWNQTSSSKSRQSTTSPASSKVISCRI